MHINESSNEMTTMQLAEPLVESKGIIPMLVDLNDPNSATNPEWMALRKRWKDISKTQYPSGYIHALYYIIAGKDLFNCFTPYRNAKKLEHNAPYASLSSILHSIWSDAKFYSTKPNATYKAKLTSVMGVTLLDMTDEQISRVELICTEYMAKIKSL